jgi:predicted ribosomally synthesized peptide with SipW-like signal peptide
MSAIRRLGWRVLLTLALVLGVLGAQGGTGTLAYYAGSATSPNNIFAMGKLDISASKLASGKGESITFSTDGTTTSGADCDRYDRPGTIIADQPLTPGVYCVGTLTINNSTSTIFSWLRVRLVRTTGSTVAGHPDRVLNETLKLYVNEIAAVDVPNCNTAGYNPNVLSLGGPSAPVKLSTNNPVNGKTIGGLLGPTSLGLNGQGTILVDPMVNGSYVNLIGNDNINLALAAGATSAELVPGTSRYFCLMIYFPSKDTASSLANGDKNGDNAAQGGHNTYVLHMITSQKTGR